MRFIFSVGVAFWCVARGDIHAAVRADDPAKLQEALDAGEDINMIGPGGQTPLMHGVLTGNPVCVKYLLDAKADTSIPEKDGYTPMHGAGFQGRAEIAKMLIAYRLNPSDKHKDGFTPLHRACWGSEQRHADTVRALLRAGVPYDQPADNGQRCLDMTSNEATKKLLEKRAALEKRALEKMEKRAAKAAKTQEL